MQNDDEDLLSVSLASHDHLVKMLIHGLFSLNFAYLYSLRLCSLYQIK